MLLKMNRFMKVRDVPDAYQVPAPLVPAVKEALKAIVVFTDPVNGDDHVQERAVDALLERQFGSGHVNQPDGLYPPSRIRLNGTDYDGLSGKRWHLIECLWGRRFMPVTDVIEAVWGTDADQTGGALTSLSKHLNAWLRKEDCPLAVQTRKGHVRLVQTGPAGKK